MSSFVKSQAAGNLPGAGIAPAMVCDTSGNLWLLGGGGASHLRMTAIAYFCSFFTAYTGEEIDFSGWFVAALSDSP